MKKCFAMMMALVMMITMLLGGSALADGKKISVVTTIFPIYDWVREVAGDNANVDVTLLLDNGVDLHSYQPTAQDIMKVATADVFIYVGGESDEWVEDALAEAVNPDMKVISLLDALGDAVKEEEVVEGMEAEHDHDHEHEEELTADDIKDRELSDFAGEWVSLQPMMAAGELDTFCEHKAEDDESASAEDYRAKYTEGWMCDAVKMTVTDSTITFVYADGTSVSAEYVPAGYSIKYAEDGDISSVRYQFETTSNDAPHYVQFNDHGHEPGAAEHFHVYFGNEGFEAMMLSATNPYFAPASLDLDGILDMLIGHNHEHHHGDEEEAELDEHVWLSLRNAEVLVQSIADVLSEADADNAAAYQANAAAYIEKLAALDAQYADMVAQAEYKTVLFGDRFPFRYLVDDYGLTYYAAFVGCSAETEASFETIVFLAQKVDELDLPAVLTIEGVNHRIAETIVGATTAKDQKILTVDSLQGKPADGATYLSVMEANLSVLRDALNK